MNVKLYRVSQSEEEDEEKDLLFEEIKKLNNYIAKIGDIDQDLNSQIKDSTNNIMNEAEDVKIKLENSEKSKLNIDLLRLATCFYFLLIEF